MPEPVLTQDMHVHSTFSDGKNTIEENIAEAERIGLTELTCVDHVRADTEWVPDYVAAVRGAAEQTPIALHCAVEAKILDTEGRLDVPPAWMAWTRSMRQTTRWPRPTGRCTPARCASRSRRGSWTAKRCCSG